MPLTPPEISGPTGMYSPGATPAAAPDKNEKHHEHDGGGTRTRPVRLSHSLPGKWRNPGLLARGKLHQFLAKGGRILAGHTGARSDLSEVILCASKKNLVHVSPGASGGELLQVSGGSAEERGLSPGAAPAAPIEQGLMPRLASGSPEPAPARGAPHERHAWLLPDPIPASTMHGPSESQAGPE